MYLDDALILASTRLQMALDAGAQRCTLESRIGGPLPEAFAEIVLSDAWPSFLRLHSSDDFPVPLPELGESIERDGVEYSALSHRLLPFMFENQAVCTWAIALDDGPDPPVFVEVDSLPTPRWQMACAKFSVWLYCQVWDAWPEGYWLLSAQAPPLSAETLLALRSTSHEVPSTYGWPARNIYRFESPAAKVLLWAADDQCDWFVGGENLDRALDSLPKDDAVFAAFYGSAPHIDARLASRAGTKV